MDELLANTFYVLLGYFLGSLTVGYYIVRCQLDKDVRDSGSGSAGATNVGRLLGKKGFLLTFAGDFGKGMLALLLARWGGCHDPWLVMVLLAVVAGHVWPLQLKFNGGKGAASAFGGLIIYDPVLTLALMCLFLMAFAVSSDREVGGMTVFLCLPVAVALTGRPVIVITSFLALAFVLLWAHRDNFMVICRRGGVR